MKLLILFLLLLISSPSFAHDKETAYDSVMKTGTLRCGYQVYPPYINKNIKTGKFEGIYPDIFHEIAKESGLKIEWVEEVSSETMFTGLDSGRYDALCTPLSPTSARAKIAGFTKPILYVPFYIYVAANETGFDNKSLHRLNKEDVTFLIKDGDLIEILTNQYFSQAKQLSVSGLTDSAQMYLSVANGKADAIINEPVYANIFMQQNPNKIRQVLGTPLRVVPATAAVSIREHALRHFLSTSFLHLIETGFIENTLSKHIENSEDLIPVKQSYEASK